MKPLFVVIHHSKAKDRSTLDWQGIRDWHIGPPNNWTDIGYNFGIEMVKGQVEVLIGRMPTERGAHCKSLNGKSWGICIVGDFDADRPSVALWDTAVRLVSSLCDLGDIPTDQVVGHREGDPNTKKSCPGNAFDMNAFRKDVFTYRVKHSGMKA
ncbi:hypothetical protein LCGC14_1583610 [marine sediment metagenome]|uniref:Peptidoglycan recognition protein family domain-containing protein n=1 Tax=marine sediment metagenome TaxID=412755 RepID=A0A0F9LGE1_9ZZZZ